MNSWGLALWIDYGFLWPQDYNNVLRLDFPFRNYDILESMRNRPERAMRLKRDNTVAEALSCMSHVDSHQVAKWRRYS